MKHRILLALLAAIALACPAFRAEDRLRLLILLPTIENEPCDDTQSLGPLPFACFIVFEPGADGFYQPAWPGLPVRLSEVKWTDGLWHQRLATCREATVPAMWEIMRGTKSCPIWRSTSPAGRRPSTCCRSSPRAGPRSACRASARAWTLPAPGRSSAPRTATTPARSGSPSGAAPTCSPGGSSGWRPARRR